GERRPTVESELIPWGCGNGCRVGCLHHPFRVRFPAAAVTNMPGDARRIRSANWIPTAMILTEDTEQVNGFDRLPPHNRDAERALLGSLLRDPGIIDEVAKLIRAEHFYVFGHQQIFAAIVELGERADLVTVAERLTATKNLMDDAGGHAYLADLWEAAPCAAQYREYAAS